MTAQQPEARPPLPLILRVLSGLGAVIVFLVALVVSFGATIGTPVGLFLARRSARRRNRLPTRIGSFFGAIGASAVLGVVIWAVLFSVMPRPSQEELDRAAAEAKTRQAVKLPSWYSKAFPQAAKTDSATERLMRSPQFFRVFIGVGAVMIGAFMGVIGGSLGWCASLLLGLARAGP
jgi:hypothetical protein